LEIYTSVIKLASLVASNIIMVRQENSSEEIISSSFGKKFLPFKAQLRYLFHRYKALTFIAGDHKEYN